MKPSPTSRSGKPPRLGFLGIGWIGFQRMEAIVKDGSGCIAAVCDRSSDAIAKALQSYPEARATSWDEMLNMDLDGIVIATPSALHCDQTLAALQRGIPVFCQKPLGRTCAEVSAMVKAAREANVLLGVDLSYRYTSALRKVREIVKRGDVGRIYAANLVFHNAYGPDKPWFYQPNLSGGGCVIDLGIHLIDLAFWILESPLTDVSSRLYHQGKSLSDPRGEVEDYAAAQLHFASGATAQLTCSWNLHAGRDAIIEAAFYGDRGGVMLRNVNGSFLDFVAEQFSRTSTQRIAGPPDEWGGRAAVDWARRLAKGEGFDPGIERSIDVADALDRIYAASH